MTATADAAIAALKAHGSLRCGPSRSPIRATTRRQDTARHAAERFERLLRGFILRL